MSERIGIIGAGAWGTAAAKVLAECGHDVTIWCNEPETAADIKDRHRNERFLPDVDLPRGIVAQTDALAAATGKDVIVLAVPSPFLMGVVRRILSAPNVMEGESLVVVLTKGFIGGPHGPRLIVEALEEHLPGFYGGNVVYLSGPSHAAEVARGRITGLAAASANGLNAIRVRELFRGSHVLVFPSLDSVGVQVCAATKNVVAIAFGMLDALAGAEGRSEAFGYNTESLLLAAGLNEMQSIGRSLGATHAETFTSLAGVGDLDVTCRYLQGRNRRFGREIIQKRILEPFRDIDDLLARLGEIGYLPEGAVAVKHVAQIAAAKRLDLPIMLGVHEILDRKVEPLEFLESYLGSLGASGT